MKRLVIIYNPRSSGYRRVEVEVLGRAPEGTTLFEVADTSVDDNAGRFSEFVRDGDLVVAAGGDGTVTIAANGILLSKKKARLGVLPYGNFNDLARTFGLKTLEEIIKCEQFERARPVEAIVDGKHWRYAIGYFTIGMFAEACRVFDEEACRRKLQKTGGGLIRSIGVLARWWLGERKKKFLPREYKINGRVVRDTTDYIALNGPKMARVMRGRRWFLGSEFLGATGNMGRIFGLVRMMACSMIWRVPGKMTRGDILEFSTPTTIEIQGEGEYARLARVEKIEIRKAEGWIEVASRRRGL